VNRIETPGNPPKIANFAVRRLAPPQNPPVDKCVSFSKKKAHIKTDLFIASMHMHDFLDAFMHAYSHIPI
jgi:hypothetical protein